MPRLPPSPCTQARCTKYATRKSRCEDHQHKAWDHNGKTRHQRGYGNNWVKLRKQALTRDDYLCQECLREGIYTQAKEVDHVIPKTNGGTDHMSNLESICKPHHKQKSLREAKEGKS